MSDFAWYYDRAIEIFSGRGYAEGDTLTAFWPVGWPGFLAILFEITGPSVIAGQLANFVLSCASAVLMALIARKWFQNDLVAWLSVLIMATYPNQIGYVSLLSTEILYQFLLLVCLYLLMLQRTVSWVLSGVVFGFASLVKTQSVFIPLFLLAGCSILNFWRRGTAPRTDRMLRIILFVYATMILTIAPWTVRNYTVFHAFIPVSTNGGWTLLTGNNPEANGDYIPETKLTDGISHDPKQQVQMDRIAQQRAVAWIKENPGQFVKLMPLKIFHLWAIDGEAEWFFQSGYKNYDQWRGIFRCVRVLNQAYYAAICTLAIFTIWRLLRTPSLVSPWASTGAMLCIYFTLISVVFSGQSRFHFCLMPFVIIYAAATIVRWCKIGRIRPDCPQTAA
jgi:hypothetical protein